MINGCDPIGMQRDWNEKLQSCREFPHTSPQERILRDRALFKVTSDFVDAAINGAVGVISGCIPPINPTDPECFHMQIMIHLELAIFRIFVMYFVFKVSYETTFSFWRF